MLWFNAAVVEPGAGVRAGDFGEQLRDGRLQGLLAARLGSTQQGLEF